MEADVSSLRASRSSNYSERPQRTDFSGSKVGHIPVPTRKKACRTDHKYGPTINLHWQREYRCGFLATRQRVAGKRVAKKKEPVPHNFDCRLIVKREGLHDSGYTNMPIVTREKQTPC